LKKQPTKENDMKQVAIYVRVSSKQQDTASQEPDLKRFADSQGSEVEVVWYRDKFTGTTMQRPAWNKLATAIRDGKVSSVVCWRMDRLGRTAAGLTALFQELISGKVNFVSLKDGVDLSTAAGRLMANVLASVAQFETEVRRERVLAGQAAARAAGKTWGGSVKGRRLKVTAEQLDTVKRLHGEGMKIAPIARAVGLSRPTVYSCLA
jgi:DNA invertase Pin-like site-specific DNA recombinase